MIFHRDGDQPRSHPHHGLILCLLMNVGERGGGCWIGGGGVGPQSTARPPHIQLSTVFIDHLSHRQPPRQFPKHPLSLASPGTIGLARNCTSKQSNASDVKHTSDAKAARPMPRLCEGRAPSPWPAPTREHAPTSPAWQTVTSQRAATAVKITARRRVGISGWSITLPGS